MMSFRWIALATIACLNCTVARAVDVLQLLQIHQYEKVRTLDDIPKFLQVKEVCWAPARELNSLLLSYHQAAIRSQTPKSHHAQRAGKIYERIKARLLELENQNLSGASECFDAVARSYVVSAVTMLESSYDQSLLKLAAYFAYDVDGWNRGVQNPRMRILSPRRRAAMGCQWTTPGTGYAYKSYGGFFCQSASIAVDPFLPPVNLGSSVVHEIDHFLRDRYGRVAASWEEVVDLTVYDEVLSTALSAFFQLRMVFWPRQFVANRSWIWQPWMSEHTLKDFPARNGYQLESDADLFLQKGPLWQILREMKSSVPVDAPNFMVASGLLPCKDPSLPSQEFVRGDWAGGVTRSQTFFTEKMKARWDEVFRRIGAAYFGAPVHLMYSSPAMHRFPSPAYQRACFQMSPVLSLYNTPSLTSFVPEPSIQVAPLLEKIHPLLTRESGSCDLFLRATRPFSPGVIADGPMVDLAGLSESYPGPLASYAGVCDSKTSTQGNEGGKTGNEGGKTGNEGGKTGNEGGKTTDEKAKTGLGTARPCLEIR